MVKIVKNVQEGQSAREIPSAALFVPHYPFLRTKTPLALVLKDWSGIGIFQARVPVGHVCLERSRLAQFQLHVSLVLKGLLLYPDLVGAHVVPAHSGMGLSAKNVCMIQRAEKELCNALRVRLGRPKIKRHAVVPKVTFGYGK